MTDGLNQFGHILGELVGTVNNFLWTYILIAALILLGLWFTYKTKFVQIRCIPEMFRLIGEGVGSLPREGHISTFQAFCVSTASRVGVGNIAGIAIAVVLGGPGAVFWMWVIATIGAASGFVESTLAQIYKVKRPQGGFAGGPAYYIRNVIGSPFFAGLFAVLISVTYGLIFNSVQANTMALSVQTSWGVSTFATGLTVAVLTALIIFGGLTRIARVVGVMVPFMAGAYLMVAIFFTCMHIDQYPRVLYEIVTNAFDFDAAYGATFGMIVMTGIKRGLFSNEAGMGAVPNAAAAADATHPVKQGLVQALGVYFDTMVVCTASAMIVLIVPGWKESGLTGIELIQHMLSSEIGSWMNHFITVVVLFFAFSSIIGNYFYAESNFRFIKNDSKAALIIFRLACLAVIFYGAVNSFDLAWNLADIFMGLMAMMNLIAILLLGKWALAALKDYSEQRAAGKDPVFVADNVPGMPQTDCWHLDEVKDFGEGPVKEYFEEAVDADVNEA